MNKLFDVNSLGVAIAAAGALGTACFGVVEGLKWTRLGEAGFSRIMRLMGPGLMKALRRAYGPQMIELLRAQYRQDWAESPLPRTLRQGVRIGLDADNAQEIAESLGTVNADALRAAAEKEKQCAPLTDVDRAALSQFDLVVDARIDSALSSAQDLYQGTLRMTASGIAVLLAESAALLAQGVVIWLQTGWLIGLLVGILAVPLAPIANDVVNALRAATTAMRDR